MSETNTPRTDDTLKRVNQNRANLRVADVGMMHELAQSLERELASVRAELAKAHRRIHGDESEDCVFCASKKQTPGGDDPQCCLCALEAELAALRAEMEKRHDEYAKALNRRVDVENVLASIAAGKRETLAQDECRELANKLGVSPAEPTPLDRPDKPGYWWRWCDIFKRWEGPLWISLPAQTSLGKWLPAAPPRDLREGGE